MHRPASVGNCGTSSRVMLTCLLMLRICFRSQKNPQNPNGLFGRAKKTNHPKQKQVLAFVCSKSLEHIAHPPEEAPCQKAPVTLTEGLGIREASMHSFMKVLQMSGQAILDVLFLGNSF